MEEGDTKPVNHEVFLELLSVHANDTKEQSPANSAYAQQVLIKSDLVRQLLAARTGCVESVISTWFDDFRPIAENLFGESLEAHEPMSLPTTYGDFSSTVFPGVEARVRRVSLDEIMGPMLTLDLLGNE